MTTPHEADLIHQDRREQAELLQEKLEKMGVTVRIAQKTGDSSYPTEYTLTHQSISVTGPTLDLALLAFVERLLKEAKPQRPGEQHWQPVNNDWRSEPEK